MRSLFAILAYALAVSLILYSQTDGLSDESLNPSTQISQEIFQD